ncbi:MAG: hypothetical protein ACYCTB_09705 [bacterium]
MKLRVTEIGLDLFLSVMRNGEQELFIANNESEGLTIGFKGSEDKALIDKESIVYIDNDKLKKFKNNISNYFIAYSLNNDFNFIKIFKKDNADNFLKNITDADNINKILQAVISMPYDFLNMIYQIMYLQPKLNLVEKELAIRNINNNDFAPNYIYIEDNYNTSLSLSDNSVASIKYDKAIEVLLNIYNANAGFMNSNLIGKE